METMTAPAPWLVTALQEARQLVDPETTYCASCGWLRHIERVASAHKIIVRERLGSAEDGTWLFTSAYAWERSVVLDCGHTKGIVGV